MSTQPTSTDTAVAAANALAAYVRAVETGQDIGSHYEAAVAAAHVWTEARVATAHEIIMRPRVVIEPCDPKGLHVARCEHCPWTAGPTAKSELLQYAAPRHRAAHRDGAIAVTAASR